MEANGMRMDLVEVYRIIYNGPRDILRGTIVAMDYKITQFLLNDKEIEKNGYKFLFEGLDIGEKDNNLHDLVVAYNFFPEEVSSRLSATDKPIIECGDHIMLKGPSEASLYSPFAIDFNLFGAFNEFVEFNLPHHYINEISGFKSTPLRWVIPGDNGDRHFTVLYAIFDDGGEARVNIKLTKINSTFRVYGIITARTSAIQELGYSSIIFFKDKDCEEIITAGPGDDMILPLSRPFVAAPHDSELILELNLFTEDNDTLVKNIVSFEATNGVTSSEAISRICSKCVIQVGVSWRWRF